MLLLNAKEIKTCEFSLSYSLSESLIHYHFTGMDTLFKPATKRGVYQIYAASRILYQSVQIYTNY